MPVEVDKDLVEEFSKDLKSLKRKYKSLHRDLELALKVLKKRPENSSHIRRMSNLGENIKIPFYKLKKFYSSDMKGKESRNKFRVIYAYVKSVEVIILLSIYIKTNNETKDDNLTKKRIKFYYPKISKKYGESQIN